MLILYSHEVNILILSCFYVSDFILISLRVEVNVNENNFTERKEKSALMQ